MNIALNRIFKVLISISLLAGLFASNASACSCFAPDERSFAEFEHIFVGTVTARFPRADLGIQGIFGNWFDVEQRFRGAREDTIEVSALNDGNFCGYRYRIGESYLVFADASDNGAASGLCRSFPVDGVDAKRIIERLEAFY